MLKQMIIVSHMRLTTYHSKNGVLFTGTTPGNEWWVMEAQHDEEEGVYQSRKFHVDSNRSYFDHMLRIFSEKSRSLASHSAYILNIGLHHAFICEDIHIITISRKQHMAISRYSIVW